MRGSPDPDAIGAERVGIIPAYAGLTLFDVIRAQ